MNNSVLHKVDWTTIFIYLALVTIGWINIYSTTYTENPISFFDISTIYGKQLFFIEASFILIVIVLSIDSKFYERFSSLIFIISLISLLGLYVFGKTIAGATSWYGFGPFGLQPSEFAKAATALAMAKFLSDIQTNIFTVKHQLFGLLIIILPALLIVPQPDPGSAIVFLSLFFVLYREGLPAYYLLIGFFAILLFVCTLMFGTIWIAIALILIAILVFGFKNKNIKIPILPVVIGFIVSIAFSMSVQFIYDHVFEQRHRDRFGLWLRLEKDPEKLEEIKKTIGYNTLQSEETISSGGFIGKGFLEGTRTKGNFVPEQQTDYIFSTVGEEWGFIGTTTVVLLFMLLLLRLVAVAERQKTPFSRMYGYGVISILFVHFVVNIGMVIGLLPTIGIPLPFFSYGGSALLGFTLLLFIFLRLDANRGKEW